MKKIIADFHVLGLFIPKKHDLSEKKIRLSRAVLRQNSLDHNIKPRKLKFWLLESFGLT
jgi:hypothetical protein